MGKTLPINAGDIRVTGLITGLGKSPGEENGYPLQYSFFFFKLYKIVLVLPPLQYSCLENPMDRGAWGATAHGVAKNRTQLSN